MLCSTAPEAQSTNLSQQVRLFLSARRTWSAASTCQASCARSGRRGLVCGSAAAAGRGRRMIGSSASRRWMVRTDGKSSKPRRGNQQRKKGAPQPGFSARNSRTAALRGSATAAAAAVVGGAIAPRGAYQVTDRPHRQAQVQGDLRGGLALLGAATDRLADGQRGGARHGSWPSRASSVGRTTPLNLKPPAPGGKTFCRVGRQNFMSRPTAKPHGV
jgi:hypothetical protein